MCEFEQDYWDVICDLDNFVVVIDGVCLISSNIVNLYEWKRHLSTSNALHDDKYCSAVLCVGTLLALIREFCGNIEYYMRTRGRGVLQLSCEGYLVNITEKMIDVSFGGDHFLMIESLTIWANSGTNDHLREINCLLVDGKAEVL